MLHPPLRNDGLRPGIAPDPPVLLVRAWALMQSKLQTLKTASYPLCSAPFRFLSNAGPHSHYCAKPAPHFPSPTSLFSLSFRPAVYESYSTRGQAPPTPFPIFPIFPLSSHIARSAPLINFHAHRSHPFPNITPSMQDMQNLVRRVVASLHRSDGIST